MSDGAQPHTDLGVALERGQAVGRFVVLAAVGRGGMGEVYAAYDPELDRKVAVKLLRSRLSRSVDGKARLLREAQAIAKLSHPNVVVVYDVGTYRDSIFIAMEFVEGSTLGFWLEQEPRDWRQTLRLFQAAGRGLSAAHEAGMIHRDFKPENVMITRDGQVRVMDFGLARQVLAEGEQLLTQSTVEEAMEQARSAVASSDMGLIDTTILGLDETAEASGASSGGYLRAKITETGAQLGTPAYMAPEQFVSGGRIDARTDQFSFCVALYEAVYRQRPFEGDTVTELKVNVLGGVVRPPPEGTRVPTWIRRILLRGLRTEPDERWPSMAALLHALEQTPDGRRRRWLTLGAALSLMAGFAAAAHRIGSGERMLCSGGQARLAGIWEAGGARSARKDAIHRAFAQTSKPYAEQAFTAAGRLLDEYVGHWTAMYMDACEATHARGEQSAEVLDLRMACLQERLGNVRALTDVFAHADGGVVSNALAAVGALPALDRCADVTLLRAVVKPPDDPATRRRVAEQREQLARLIALRDSGQCAAAQAESTELIEAVRATGYGPLLADALTGAGLLGNACEDASVAVERLKEAYVVASATHHDQAAAEAATTIAGMAANRLGQRSMAHDWLRIAQGALQRFGSNGALESWLLLSEALVHEADHDYDRALAAEKRALALQEKGRGPDHPETLVPAINMGATLQIAGRLEEALATDRAVRARAERLLGTNHPAVGNIANNEGEVLNLLGRHEEAAAAFQRAIDIWRAAGSDPMILSYGLTGLGRALLGQARPVEAVAPLEEAVSIRIEKKLPPAMLAETRFALARALWAQRQARARGMTLARQARADLGGAGDPKALAEIDAWLTQAKAGL